MYSEAFYYMLKLQALLLQDGGFNLQEGSTNEQYLKSKQKVSPDISTT